MFLCPCHDSKFKLDGALDDTKSPSPRGMDTSDVEMRGGEEVWVRFQSFQAGTGRENACRMKPLARLAGSRAPGYRKLMHEALLRAHSRRGALALRVGQHAGLRARRAGDHRAFLWMAYSPSTQTAWESVYYIQHEMHGGWLLRGIHHFMAQAMVVLLALHLMQVVIDGAYRAPREVNFWLGLVLMQIVLGLALTGYLLPWDQKGYWATSGHEHHGHACPLRRASRCRSSSSAAATTAITR